MIEGITLINKETKKELELDMITTPYFILESCNWGTIDGTHNSTQYVNQIGVNIDSTTLGTRPVEIIGWVIADNEQEMNERKKFLNSFVNPLQELDLFYKGFRLTCKPNNTIAYTQSNSENNEMMAKFNISATAADPLFYDKDNVMVNIMNTEARLHFPLIIPTNGGIIFGERLSARLVKVNMVSDLPTGVIFDFKFKVKTVRPSIKNINYDKALKILYIFEEGDRLIINTKVGERSIDIIKADGTQIDGYKYMTIESEWPVLYPGENVLNILTDDMIPEIDSTIQAPFGLNYAGNVDLPYYFSWGAVENDGFNIYINDKLIGKVDTYNVNLESKWFPTTGTYKIGVQTIKNNKLSAITSIQHVVNNVISTPPITGPGAIVESPTEFYETPEDCCDLIVYYQGCYLEVEGCY